MMESIRKIDDRLRRLAQAAYDQLWDRMGIYLGTVFAAMCFFYSALRGFTVLSLIVSAVMLLIAVDMTIDQMRAQFVSANRRASVFEDQLIPRVIVVAAMPMDIGLPSPLREFGADIVGLSMMFVGCVRLRERKPPERKTSLIVAAS